MSRPVEQPLVDARNESRNTQLLALVVLALVIAGVVLRVWVLASPLGRPDSDEAVVGLMANDFRHGHFTTFYWGQNYGGTIEPALVALVFLVSGSSTLGLKLVPVVLSAVACVLVWRVGRRTVGEPAARFAAALFWVFPPAFLWGSTKERGFYQVGLVLVLSVLLLAIRLDEGAARAGRLPRADLIGLGLCAGLAVWTTPQTIYVLAPVAVWLGVRWRGHWREAWPVVPAGIVGGLPWLLYAARHGRSAFYQTEVASSYPERLKNFFVDMVPRAFGGKVPFSLDWLGGAAGHVAFLLLLVVALGAVGVRLRDVDARRRLEPLIVTAAAYPFLATVPRVSSFTDEPRYVLMLAPVVVLLLSSTITTTAARAMVGLGAIALGAVFVVASLAWSDDHRPDDGLAPPGLGSIERLLERRGIDHVYGDYWIAYRLMFDTDERVTASPVLSVRNDEFAAEVAAGRETPYVVYAGDVYDREFGPALHEAGISFERLVTGDYALYLPDRPVEPDRFEDIWLQSP